MSIKEMRKLPEFAIDKAVFWPASGILLALVAFAAIRPTLSEELFQSLQQGIVLYASWYYVLVVAIILVSIVVFSLSRFGDIKLGPDHSEPAYSYPSWFAMLFAAGMGIGLMFFGVAEPVMHFLAPPHGEGGTIPAAREAMQLTFFHWGFHAWAIYAIVALILAYFSYRHGLPLTMRSAFYPLIGERIYGPAGATIDVFAIVCTTCGIATSLGYGVLQINSGLAYLFGVAISPGIQVLLIAVTMILAGVSVVLGLDAGIKRLSELNLSLSLVLLVAVLVGGPTVLILQGTIENLGFYIGELVSKTFNLYAYDPTDWLGGWTIFYWGWWLSWSPFVGLFIARISRGRTIREFVLGAMVVPCLFTLLWMGVFGNSAIELILHGEQVAFGAAVEENQAIALFRFFEYLPMSSLLSGISLLMVIVFFVTSADSGALVLNMLSAKGRDDTPSLQRLYWAVVIAITAIVLLLAGGLASLQTAAIVTALPFSVALLGAIWGLGRALRLDDAKRSTQNVSPQVSLPGDWRERLSNLLQYPGDDTVHSFQRESVLPSMRAFAAELRTHDVNAKVINDIAGSGAVRLEVYQGEDTDFIYEVRCRAHALPLEGVPEKSLAELPDTDKFYRAEVHLFQGGQDYDIMGWTREQVTHDMLWQYENHLQFLHSIR
ncbi:choline transporter [Kineobactrum sediminis]|uniref:Choline transporter n=1 Tax=Kineobactrum sediminis TaxID=1905677 RepID=A0A2N5Y670_9GAMM|nr:BCCT family transporter [Kineobactrum sediminis]PLW83871.1 choline transporter [Kineobactrum sediminis]